jgi:small-conductance mechanosensitive channel
MNELAELFLHPARWASDAAALPSSTRIYLALLTLIATGLTSLAAGALTSRWARQRGEPITERGMRRLLRVRRDLVALVILVGAYLAVEMAPLPDRIEAVLAGIAYVLGAFVCARAVIRLAALVVTISVARVSGEERTHLEREYVPLVEKVSTLAVALMFAVVVAKHFGKDVSSLIAALGVGSLAIGLAAQQTLGNMIAGFVLLVDRPFRPGDRIKLASGEIGEVRDIGVRSTTIQLLDGNRLVVPNTELANSRVINFAALISHVEVKVTVAHGNDVDRVTELLASAAADERNPSVRLTNLSERGIELTVAFECATPAEAFKAEELVRRRMLGRLTDAKIAMPASLPSFGSSR